MGTKLALIPGMKPFVFLSSLVFLLGCPTPPVGDQTIIEINATVELPAPQAQISISGAFFSFSELELVSDVEIEGIGVKAEQIVSSQAESSFSLLQAPPGLYSRLEVRLKKPNPNTALPAELQGEPLSLLIEGSVQIAGGQVVPFRIQDDKQLKDVNLVLLQGLDLLPSDKAQISVRGDASRAFSGVSFDEILSEDLTDGVFLLDIRDQSFLNNHPAAKDIAAKISENISTIFEVNSAE